MKALRLSQKKSIAIVDDDRAVREAIADLLEVEGFTTLPYESATAFLNDQPCREIDCLITDVRMPGVDGLALQRRLRDNGSTLPVIFVTSVADDASRTVAMADGAFAWFMKPVPNDSLLSTLNEALDQAASSALEPPAD